MSKYTMELRRVCEVLGRETVEGWFKAYDLTEYLTDEQIETINQNSVWNKDRLAKQIVDHYFMREIGSETPGLFAHYAKTTMAEIMEGKLQMVYSTALKYNVLDANDYTEQVNRSTSASSQSSTSTTGSGLAVNSDTPQGQISKQSILGGSYASTTGATETETAGTGDSSSAATDSYTRTIKGRNGSINTPARLLEEYRKAILTINRDIIKELDILFFGIF